MSGRDISELEYNSTDAQRIAALERKVAELERLLQQLRDDYEDEKHLR